MKIASVRFTEAAITDILEQGDWYLLRSGGNLAKKWESAITAALLLIVRNPKIGAVCRFPAAELSGLRRIPISGFSKHLLFYQIDRKEVLLLRVLHGARDLENLF